MIVKNNLEILTKHCDEVASIEEAEGIVKILEQELSNSAKSGYPGVGLAANQINIHKRVAIIRLGQDYVINLANAKISKKYDPIVFEGEGCLSFPDKLIKSNRFNEIFVENNIFYPHSFVATGLLAVVIQHELDHLDGKTLNDVEIKDSPKIKIGPNEKCYCGSGKKFKKCHQK